MKTQNFGKVAASLIGLTLASSSIAALGATKDKAKDKKASADEKGECHGVNSCKGKGECGGPKWDCAGNNECKGQGWITKTSAECKKLGGKFKAEPKS